MPLLGSINHIATTIGPRPSPTAALPASCLTHHAANHPPTNNNNSAYPRALKRGGRKMRTPPAASAPNLEL